MSELPSNIKAAKFRDEGSAFYRQNKFFYALVCYNKSLCFSETNEVKSLAFANRSAVYLATKKFQQCLDNIELARKHEYPADKLSKLDEREAKCKELMEQHRPDPREDPWNFFKLSYPANKKLPFIVDCLELREDTKFGRHIITNRDLKAGDIIAIEDPFFKSLDLTHCYERCNNCLKANMLSLIPCKGRCTNTMFCSEKCAKAAESGHGKYECAALNNTSAHNSEAQKLMQKLLVDSMKIAGGVEEMQACVEENESLTIFDIDFTNPDNLQLKKKQLKAFLALMAHPGKTNTDFVDLQLQMTRKLARIKARNIYAFESSIFSNETSTWNNVKIGEVVSLFGALFNHSCDPNVRWVVVDNKPVAVVQFPIMAGDQLFVGYINSYYSFPILLRDERREILSRSFLFHCECSACFNDLKIFEMQQTDKNFKMSDSLFSLNPIKDFNENCEYIDENFKKHPLETIFSIDSNVKLLFQISQFGSLKQ